MSGDLHSEVDGRIEGGRGHRTLVDRVDRAAGHVPLDVRGPERRPRDGGRRRPRRRSRARRPLRPRPRLRRTRPTAARHRPSRPAHRGSRRATGRSLAAYEDARLAVLRSLERGEIDVAEAERRFEALDGGEPLGGRPRPTMTSTRRRTRRGSRPWTRTMPDEALEGVLRLLAEGRLTAEEAGPIIDALDGGPVRTAIRAARRTTGSRRPAARRPGTRQRQARRGPCASRSPRRAGRSSTCASRCRSAGPRSARSRASPRRPRIGSARRSRPASRAPSSRSTTPGDGVRISIE